MKLENLGKNQTRVIVQIPDEELDLTWDKDIYFSSKEVLAFKFFVKHF